MRKLQTEEGKTESQGNIDEPIFRKGNIGIGTDKIKSKLQIAINSGEDLDIQKGIEIDNSNSVAWVYLGPYSTQMPENNQNF